MRLRADEGAQAIRNVPLAYQRLRSVAIDCTRQIRFDEDASRVFETDRVRRLLTSSMDLVIRALELISQQYSGSRISK